jgi:hypothetical protein
MSRYVHSYKLCPLSVFTNAEIYQVETRVSHGNEDVDVGHLRCNAV